MKFDPFTPFEPIQTNYYPTGPQWISQIKWDGVRIITYHDGHGVELYNRKQHERTFHYPELTEINVYSNAESVILDGEVIALDNNGKPSFHHVMRRDGIRRLDKVKTLRSKVPITYMIFDILYLNGEWINHKPLVERMKILEKVISPNPNIQVVTAYPKGEDLFSVIKEHDLEGIVIKDINSAYLINGKDKRWQKLKNYKDLVAIIGGVTYRDNIINSLLLGLYDNDGDLWYIGHAGTGRLTQLEWRQLTESIKPFIQSDIPFVNKPSKGKGAVWIKPKIMVKVKYIEWTSGYTLRQPSIQAIVDDHADIYPFSSGIE